jgi:hypothetical protein
VAAMFFLVVLSIIQPVALAVYASGSERSRPPIAVRVGVCIERVWLKVEGAAL